MQPEKIVINLLIFAVFVFGGIFIMYGNVTDPEAGLLQAYDVPKDNLASDLENLTSTKVIGQKVENLTSQQKTDTGDQIDKSTFWRVIDVGPVRAIRRMYEYFSSVGILIMEIGTIFHIPSFFLDTMGFIMIVIVVFMVMYFLMKFQLRDN